ncbi:CHAT domain-containing protein [Sphingomonas sp. MMS24-J45]|uniref:CHAT domain-containing protein n=1 Tax=Sphingomonas sp. MMS24-J45 TaxID=3238806 RepID=UPI00385132C9
MEYDWNALSELQSKLFELLWAQHFDNIRNLEVSLVGDTVVLRGEVGTETARSDAKRLALGFDGVFKVRNEIEVAGYFVAASDTTGDDYFGSGEETGQQSNDHSSTGGTKNDSEVREADKTAFEEVIRHPTVDADGVFSAGERITLTVDLVKDAQPGQPSITVGEFPVGWDQIDVEVHIYAPWASEFEALSPRIALTKAGSEAAVFNLTVAKTYVVGSPAPVEISFLNGTRVCGHLSRDLAPPIAASADGPKADDHPKQSAVAVAEAPDAEQARDNIRIQPSAPGPTLSITIITERDGHQTWMWVARLPKTQITGSANITHKADEEKFAAELLASCPDLRDDEFRRVMAGIGERVWRATPEKFRTAYIKCRSEVGSDFPIQLITADPFVPWEMMKPDSEEFEADHLFFDHPICRWPLNAAGDLRSEFISADRLSFVPTYQGSDDLPSARSEGEWLEKTLRAVRMTADRATFLDVLDGNHSSRIGLLHFAGHGRADSGVKDGGVKLQDGWVGVNEVDQSRVKLGRKDGSLVVLNACESGAGSKFLGMNTGWGTTIANRGFGGLIAPLWEVHDQVAFDLMKLALEPLADGRQTLGHATTAARKAQSDLSISSFAYLAHGDVMARFIT